MSIQTINVTQDFDVVVSRSRVRELARIIGMSTADQARIALATSSAAHALGLGRFCRGRILIQDIESEGRRGIRVVCETECGLEQRPETGAFADAQAMADEVLVNELPGNQFQATLTKWSR